MKYSATTSPREPNGYPQPLPLPRPGRLMQYIQARVRAPRLDHECVEQVLRAYNLRLLRPPQNLPFGWRSHNVVLNTSAGKKVLKRYRAAWPAETIAHEHAILKELQASDFPAPRLVLTSRNESTLEWGGHFYALYDYIEGRNYAGSVVLPAQRNHLVRQAGIALARLHGQLHEFIPAGEHHLGYISNSDRRQRDLNWHLERLESLSSRAEEIQNLRAREDARWLARQSGAIARRMEQLEKKVADASLVQTVIHGDYGIHNLHFQTRGSHAVTVLDFELARREWRLLDLISVLARFGRDNRGFEQSREFIGAYESACLEASSPMALTEDEWRLLPDIWQLYRLRGAVQYWHTYAQQGGARRLSAARQRLLEGEWALQHRPELCMLRPLSHRPRRVMMVVRLFYPWIGGAERQAQRLAKALLEEDTSVEILTGWWYRNTARREFLDGIPVHRNFTFWHALDIPGLRKFSGYLYILTLQLALWRRRQAIDVIHVHGLNYHTFAAVLAGRRLRIPVIVKLANSGPASDIKKMQQDRQLALAHKMLPTALQADRFVALNPTIASELLNAGVASHKIVEIPNGIDVTAFDVKQDYHLHAPARIVYVGRLHEQKGVETLLQAARLWQDNGAEPAFRVRLIGDGPARSQLQELAVQLGITEQVEFAGLRQEIRPELETADIFVLPSRAEGLSNALLEAMSCALPVVASDIPGNANVIHSGENGLLFQAEDEHDLAAALCTLLEQQALRARLGCAARATVERTYSLNAIARRYSALYQELS